MKPARIVSALALSGVLFLLYFLFREEPLRVGGTDIREYVFGKKERALLFVALIPVIFVLVRLIDAVLFDLFVSRKKRAPVPELLREILSIVFFFLLFAWATSIVFQQSITGWLFTGTVLAAVLGFALQDTLGNLFAGISLHLEDSFEVGDVVRSGDHVGVVEAVRWRATRLRTVNNNLVILPNSQLAREHLEVYPAANLNGRLVTVGIDYNVPPATAIAVLTQAALHVEGIAREMPCIARVASFGDSAVVYEIKYFTRDYAQRDRIDADVRKAVWYALRRNRISIPFPVRSYQRYVAEKRDDHAVAQDELLLRLRAVDILSPLSDAAHQALADAAMVHYYSKGETIIRHGGAGNSMFIVHDGTVSVRVPDESGGVHEVAQLGTGSVFGEMALLTGETRVADVIALTDVNAFEIGKSALQPILLEHPELAQAISGKVLERQDRLDTIRAGRPEEDQKTMLSRIRAYFGL